MKSNVLLLLVALGGAFVPATASEFIRGDVNETGDVTVADATAIGMFMNGDFRSWYCEDAADISDGSSPYTGLLENQLYLWNFLRGSIDTLPPPYPNPGPDPTPDQYDCQTYDPHPPKLSQFSLHGADVELEPGMEGFVGLELDWVMDVAAISFNVKSPHPGIVFQQAQLIRKWTEEGSPFNITMAEVVEEDGLTAARFLLGAFMGLPRMQLEGEICWISFRVEENVPPGEYTLEFPDSSAGLYLPPRIVTLKRNWQSLRDLELKLRTEPPKIKVFAPARFSVEPRRVVYEGEEFTLHVKARIASPFEGFSFGLKYDTHLLEALEILPGDDLGPDNVSAWETQLLPKGLTIVAAGRFPAIAGVEGGVVAKIRFRAAGDIAWRPQERTEEVMLRFSDDLGSPPVPLSFTMSGEVKKARSSDGKILVHALPLLYFERCGAVAEGQEDYV